MPSLFNRSKNRIPSTDAAVSGRAAEMAVPARHVVLDAPLRPPFADGIESALLR